MPEQEQQHHHKCPIVYMVGLKKKVFIEKNIYKILIKTVLSKKLKLQMSDRKAQIAQSKVK